MKPVRGIVFGLMRGALLTFFFPTIAFAAPRLYLDPATASVASGSTVSVNLMIDTDQLATAADAKITFPKALIAVSSVTSGTFFDSLTKIISNQTGVLEIHGYFSSASLSQSKSGKDILATITLSGIAPGTATLAVPCAPSTTTDANIADPNGKDMIVCSGVSGSEITITQSATGSIVKPTPTPGTLPRAGVEFPTVSVLGAGAMLVGIGFLAMRKVAV